MNVKQAVAKAKRHILALFVDEGITQVGLEEIEFDDSERIWKITIGFSRSWDQNMESLLGGRNSRTYKKLIIRDFDGEVLSVKNLITSQD